MESDMVCGCCGVGDTCIWGFALWCKKAKRKCSGDSRLCVQKSQELDAGREVQFIWLLLFLAQQQCLAYKHWWQGSWANVSLQYSLFSDCSYQQTH